MKEIYRQQEHTGSYYAASVNEVTDYPELLGEHSVDVCVVGAGFTGISTALSLTEKGYKVAVVEGNRVGWGASGRNGGQVINGISGLSKIEKKVGDEYADMIWDLKWRGNEIIHERVAKYGIDCDLKHGFLEVALKEKQVPWLDEYAKEREAHGMSDSYEMWDRAKTQDMLGTEEFIGGFLCLKDGHVHPLNLCIGEAKGGP